MSAPPPIARREPHPVTAHGDTRVDDWYWLRDREQPEVVAHLEAERAYARERAAPRDGLTSAIFEEIRSRVRLDDVSAPAKRGDFGYYRRTRADAQYPIWCRRPWGSPSPDPDGADDLEVVVLDESLLAEGHDHFSLGDLEIDPGGNLVAYATDTTGAEILTIAIRDLASGLDLSDSLEGAYYGLAWSSDSSELLYVRPDEAMRPFQCWRHRLGTTQAEDTLCFEEPDERYFLGIGTTKDHRFVVLALSSNITSEIWLADAAGGDFSVVATRREGIEYSIEHCGNEVLILVNDDGATNFRVVRAPDDAPGLSHWIDFVPHRPGTLIEGIDVMEDRLIVTERGDATTRVRVLPLDGSEPTVIESEEASVVWLGENLEFASTSLRYVTTSLVTPRETWDLDLRNGERTLVRRDPVLGEFDPARYRTVRLEATASDGQRVPITVAERVDRARPGPLLIYGYGAYGLSTDPTFSISRLSLLDRGFAFAIAHVRGGEELGREWYLDGKLEHKTNSFSDLVAAARHLVEIGWTSADQLVVRGGSAGGLLVGAALNIDPDLFASAVAEVPFVDCLTTLLDPSLPLTVIEWDEWGDPLHDEEAYRRIRSWSPYDNVRPVRYPKLLVTGGVEDPRVGYFEPAKWVQRLRAAHPDNVDRVVFDVETAGHAGPSGRDRSWQKEASVLAFVISSLSGEV